MEKLVIRGGHRLDGELQIHGAKNAALPILAASLLTERCVLHNCPLLTDVDAACDILECLGSHTNRTGDCVLVEAGGAGCCCIPEELMHRMRSSIVFLGAVVAKCGSARISLPGGCELGPRPIDLHLSALERMGVHIEEDHGFLNCEVRGGLHGAVITLPFPSVGATENVMITASLAKGETVIKNAAREPEIGDLAAFLNACGAQVGLTADGDVHIHGVRRLSGCEYHVMGDRIAAATFLCAGALTGGDVRVTGVRSEHLSAVLPCFEELGCTVEVEREAVRIQRRGGLRPLQLVRTMPYPGFPTDAQAPLMAVSTLAQGSSLFVENIFESRYKHVPELGRMGADIKVEGRLAVVRGVKALHSANVWCTDLRGGAALAIAALAAEGESVIHQIEHIDRGYELIERQMAALGGEVWRE